VSRENRRFARVRPAGLVSRSAKIIVDAKSPALDCSVVDLSSGGACLDVANPAAVPKRFVLLHGNIKKSCLVVWRTARRVGVQF
jgi:hypothetical protein